MEGTQMRLVVNIALVVAVVGTATCGVVRAQALGGSGLQRTETAQQLLSDFQSSTGASVVTNGDIDLDAGVIVPAQGFANRSQELNAIATVLDCTWQKVYLVTPSDATHPVVRLADAESFTDGQGIVSFDAQALPAASAIAAAAQADGATAVVYGTLPTVSVSLRTANLTVPQAIATVSALTSTNWRLTYRFTRNADEGTFVASASNAGGLVPRYMRRERTAPPTDATSLMPGYYEPFFIHAPADPVTYDPFGEVLYSPSNDGGVNLPTMPQVVAPVGTGLMSTGYNGMIAPVSPTTPYVPYVAPEVAVPAPAATTTTTTITPAATPTAPATTTTTTTATPNTSAVVVP